jgi:hypothetical protein
MGISLSILDLIVVSSVVIGVSRAVWKGQPDSSRSLLLSACVALALIVFGLVSLSAAFGLAGSSSRNQTALLVFLVPIAIVARMFWANKPA